MNDPYVDPPIGTLPPAIVSVVPKPNNLSEVTVMRPDVTKVQIIALVQAVIGLLAAFGLDLSKAQSEAILELTGQLGVALILADAALRGMRNLSDRPTIKP
jgi:hypothetical protein